MENSKAKQRELMKKWLPYIIPPVIVMLTVLANYFRNHLYPFGTGTVAWCDMTQQVVPLLCDLKDILTLKSGLFLNFNNAGGMNMWAVIFFFVASPFSLLVVFVDKADMIFFANILVMLKLMTCALTAVIYFRRRIPRLGSFMGGIFAVSYALSGYAMLYYQNCIWLDMMYLFPLLLTAFGEMFDNRRVLPYTAVLTLMMVVNYYIGYMIVVYILLFMGLVCVRYIKDEKYAHAGIDFILGSALAALCSAVVWLPSFVEYLSSGRKESVFETLENTGFYARYQTTLPTLMCSVFVLVIALGCIMDGRRREKKANTYLIMFVLLFIPLYIEPVNLMWHTGSYMSFPSRYAFMTQFVLTAAAAMMISDTQARPEPEPERRDKLPMIGLCMAVLFGISKFSMSFVSENRETIGSYASSLWGNDKSFHLIIKLSIFLGLAYLFYFILYRKGKLSRDLFCLICAILVAMEGYNNLDIYVSMPNVNVPERATDQREVMDLADRLDDTDFYRVRTTSKLFDVNLVGAMGYGSVSHYTSLTSEDYMFMMKRLGYSSYWMEVGSYGGTALTDSILCMKYEISKDEPDISTAYSNDTYSLDYDDDFLPLGIVTDGADERTLDGMTRAQVQEFLYDNTLGAQGETLVTEYMPDDERFDRTSVGYKANTGSVEVYSIDVSGRQALYFDCFDKPSNALNEKINESFSVTVDGSVKSGAYPSKSSNGLIYLGTFQDESVIISVECKKDVSCASLGVFGIDMELLETARRRAATVGFEQKRGTLTGEVAAEQGQKCILSIPYSDQLNIRVNGKRVEYRRIFDDMVVIDLEQGINEIKITGSCKGFIPGLLLTLAGIALCILYRRFRRKIKYSDTLVLTARFITIALGTLALIMIYIFPLIINMRAKKGI